MFMKITYMYILCELFCCIAISCGARVSPKTLSPTLLATSLVELQLPQCTNEHSQSLSSPSNDMLTKIADVGVESSSVSLYQTITDRKDGLSEAMKSARQAILLLLPVTCPQQSQSPREAVVNAYALQFQAAIIIWQVHNFHVEGRPPQGVWDIFLATRNWLLERRSV